MNHTGTAALAFGLTVAMEWPLFAWFSGIGLRSTALFCLLLNVATWFTLAGVLARWDAPVPLLEVGVIVAETALIAFFWRWRAGRAFKAALLMNLTSWVLGGALLWAVLSL